MILSLLLGIDVVWSVCAYRNRGGRRERQRPLKAWKYTGYARHDKDGMEAILA